MRGDWLAAVIRKVLTWLTAAYLVALGVLLMGMIWRGERSWPLSVCLYLPPQGWLLPLLVLTPLCAIFRARLCLWHALAAAVVFGPFMGLRWSADRPSSEEDLVVVTNNFGENNGLDLQPFLDEMKPDIIALQDAWNAASRMKHAYPDRDIASVRQFLLVSRFPIEKSELLMSPIWRGYAAVARFQVRFQERPISIYNVHLPTPRSDIMQLRGVVRRMVANPKDFHDPFGWAAYPAAVAQRIEQAKYLAETFARDPNPVIALGDFNTPGPGYVHRLLSSQLTDCFAECGRGYGFTFPGDSPHPVSFFQPWLRIDYVFAGKGWRPISASTEPSRRSQHRALAVRVSLPRSVEN